MAVTTAASSCESEVKFSFYLKFAEYPCFSVVLASSLHFPKDKSFCLHNLFVCFRINLILLCLKEDSELKLLKT